MGLHEATAIVAIITITIGCSGMIATFVAALTVYRSRSRGWGHFFGRVLRMTVAIAAIAVLAEGILVAWDFAST